MELLPLLQKIKSKLYSNLGLFVFSLIFILIIFFSLKGERVFEDNPLDQENRLEEVSLSAPKDDVAEIYSLESSIPTKILIPKIGVEADFGVALGVDEDGVIEVPVDYNKAGWYKYSPTPGEFGPAVVLGHVDSLSGPAVFFSLGQLKVGDDIYIEREDGSTAHFKVEKSERIQQSNFPTEQVYGDINYAGLRLVTCSGVFVRGMQRYTHNLIVYARLVK